MDVQEVGTIVSSLGVVVAVLALVREISANRHERQFAIFLRLLDAYEGVRGQRRQVWGRLKEVVRSNSTLAHEIGDHTGGIDYLLTRARQEEPLYAVEHELLEMEIRSLNVLNELCRLAKGDELRTALLASLLGSEISFYQNRLADIQNLRSREGKSRLFSIPRHSALSAFSIQDYFESSPLH